MSPVIRIPDPTFERLRAIARPFDDTPASVIDRLLDFYASQGKPTLHPEGHVHEPRPVGHGLGFDPDRAPDLTHTRVISASFAGRPASGWNELVHVAHLVAMDRLKSFEAVSSASLSNIAKGRRGDKGFRYIRDLDLAIQNVDANMAWRNVLHLAKKLGVTVKAEFEWRQKDQAAHPGKQAFLSWGAGPSTSDRSPRRETAEWRPVGEA